MLEDRLCKIYELKCEIEGYIDRVAEVVDIGYREGATIDWVVNGLERTIKLQSNGPIKAELFLIWVEGLGLKNRLHSLEQPLIDFEMFEKLPTVRITRMRKMQS